ncbi:unnamed protein product [Rhodiola kirilowii]
MLLTFINEQFDLEVEIWSTEAGKDWRQKHEVETYFVHVAHFN